MPAVNVIAELSNAHEGFFETACALIDAAKAAGVDAVKVQRFTADELVATRHPRYQHFRELEFSESQWRALVQRAQAAGLAMWSDVFGPQSALAMQSLGVEGFKIHASDVANLPLLRLVASFKRPVLLGCGGSTLLEIREALDRLRRGGCPQVVLMHGFQAFPTALEDTHLARVSLLREQFGMPVGLSDHAAGDSEWSRLIPLAAVMMGVSVIEKHITLDRRARGIDHHSALEPMEMARLVGEIRQAERVRGSFTFAFGAEEQRYRRQVKKQLVAVEPLPVGTVLEERHVTCRRADASCAPLKMAHAVGRRVIRTVEPDQALTWLDVKVRAALLIIVRLHSTRLPRKALVPIAGRTALEHLIERAQLATQPDVVVVCTSTHPDDDAIARIAQAAGVPCVRGSEHDVLGRMIQAAREMEAELVVRVTGDDILLDPVHVDRAILWHRAHNADYTNIVGLPTGAECEVYSRWALEQAHAMADDVQQTEYLTWYMDRPDLFEVSTMDADAEARRPYRLTLDTPEDLSVIRPALEAVYRPERPYRLAELLQWLDAHPEVAARNTRVQPKVAKEAINTRLAAAP